MQVGSSTTEYTWSWGDITKSVEFGNVTQTHTYSQPGSYNIFVAITENGETFSVQRSIFVSGNNNPCMKLILKIMCDVNYYFR